MLTTALRDPAGSAEPFLAAPIPRSHAADSAPRAVPEAPIERYGYQASRGSRLFGSIGTLSIIPLILIVAIVSLEETDRHKAPPPPLTVMMVPTATPPHPETKVEPQKPVQKQVRPAEPKPVLAAQPPIIQMPVPQIAIPTVAHVAPDPRPQPVEVTPPAPPVATPAQAPARASHGPDRWEGRVLARLEEFRRYPADAKRSRQQGTVLVRFSIDRGGHILSSSMERSSGNPALDQAAMETLHRADPLPKIPADRPDQVELVVPIEFTLGR